MDSTTLCVTNEGDPLHHPEGEAAQGEHPLDLFRHETRTTTSATARVKPGRPSDPPRGWDCLRKLREFFFKWYIIWKYPTLFKTRIGNP